MNHLVTYASVVAAFAALALILLIHFGIKLRHFIRTGSWRERPRETSKKRRARRHKARKLHVPKAGSAGTPYTETVHGSTVAGSNFTVNAGGSDSSN
jgi:hypothetical protein